MKRILLATLVPGIMLLALSSAQAQVMTIIYVDSFNFGFNDQTQVAPAPGNEATTLGGQRRAALEKAVDILASRLDSNIPIRLRVRFEDLGCGDRTILGQAGSLGLARNFTNAPEFEVNFPFSLAAALSGNLFMNSSAEMQASFNFRVDQGNCSENFTGFWYGLDPDIVPAFETVSFLELALHEIGHGLGFQAFVDRDSFQFHFNRPDRMSRFIHSTAFNTNWRNLTPNQRQASSTSGNGLVFTGQRTNLRAAERLLPPSRIILEDANAIEYSAFVQGFPPHLPLEGLNAPLVLADGPGPGPGPNDPWHRTLACEPLSNTGAVAGSIVLVKRGECTFASKWQNVFDAGGVAMVVVDNVPSSDDGSIARDSSMALDRNLAIPLWSVSQSDGNLIRPLLPLDDVHLGYDIDAPARGTNQGLVNLQASTENTRANVSHFSTSMFPRSVMNPSLTNTAYQGMIDMLPEFLHDMGWQTSESRLAHYSGNWFNPDRDGEGCQLTMDQNQALPVLTCYYYRDGEQFWIIGTGQHLGDRFEFDPMFITSGADFGSGFDADDVQISEWGSVRIDLIDCNNARFSLFPNDDDLPEFVTTKTRIVPVQCNIRSSQQPNRLLNGNYYDPDRDGEGLQLALEANPNVWALSFYTYLNGKQVWMIGAGERSGNTIHFDPMSITSGGQFGPDFNPDDIEVTTFGTITLEFSDCNNLEVTIGSVLPEFESSQRNMTRIVPRQCN
jgi:hypothetical protein